MTQFELVCALASSTGESISEIRRRGFNLADPLDADYDPVPCESLPRTIPSRRCGHQLDRTSNT